MMPRIHIAGLVSWGTLFCIAVIPIREAVAESAATLATATVEAIRKESNRNYTRSRFCRPRKIDPSITTHEFAPLIVEELGGGEASAPKMGLSDPITKSAVFEPGTVYFDQATVQADGARLEQLLYLWAYKGTDDLKTGMRSKGIVRGVRVILGQDGMPIVWEVAGGVGNVRVFYVVKSLEEAARKQFGDPLPGRSFSIERSVDEAPKIVVVRVLDDGPVPMGPYVYVDSSADRNITTVHCRCSPSQFDEATETMQYEFLPLENLDASRLSERFIVRLEELRECGPLESFFRLPKISP